MTAAGMSLYVVRGVVTASEEQMHSVRIDRSTGYGRINKTPELWVREQDGKEHRYQGEMFHAAQPGHDVAVVIEKPSGKPLAFANFTTGVVHDGAELNASTTIGAALISTFGLSVLLAIPGLLVWGAVLETIGIGEKAFTAGGFQIYIVLLMVSVYVGLAFWSKGYRGRSEALREEIDCLLSQANMTES